jgi:hypothetical protein
MKALLTGLLALATSSVFAQNLTKAQVASLLQSKKAILEAVNPGMSKTVVTNSSLSINDGPECDFRQTAVQTVLKIEGDRMIILSQEKFQPAATAACTAAEVEAFEESVLFYEAKPSVEQDIQDLNASDMKSASRIGDSLTMTVSGALTNDDGTTVNELLTVKYDLTKSSFKNLILSQTPSFKIETTDMPDIDVNTLDLHDVAFCENNDEDKEDCVRGDFSDILF